MTSTATFIGEGGVPRCRVCAGALKDDVIDARRRTARVGAEVEQGDERRRHTVPPPDGTSTGWLAVGHPTKRARMICAPSESPVRMPLPNWFVSDPNVVPSTVTDAPCTGAPATLSTVNVIVLHP